MVEDGATDAITHDGVALPRSPAIPARPGDTVGAGDDFDAVFAAATPAGMPTTAAPEPATACGALPTRAHGGTSARHTWDEAVAAVAHYGKTHR